VTTPSRRLLLVDDDAPTRSLLRELGEEAGFEVQEAASGEDALRAIASNRPDVVLLDVRMPKMDGFEVLKSLRRIPGNEDTPVILLSATPDVKGKIRGMELGANDFITKPFKVDDLKTRIRSALDSSDHHRRVTAAGTEMTKLRALDPATKAGTAAQLKASLESEFGRAQRFGRPLAALRIGLQDFQALRVELGEQACDQLLTALAERMRNSLRGADRLFRMEADEFVVLLAETDIRGARIVADRLGTIMRTQAEAMGTTHVPVRARIGGAAFPSDKIATAEDLLREAHQSFGPSNAP
jgi:diguanylate cyclase (GGDEF)-like protein